MKTSSLTSFYHKLSITGIYCSFAIYLKVEILRGWCTPARTRFLSNAFQCSSGSKVKPKGVFLQSIVVGQDVPIYQEILSINILKKLVYFLINNFHCIKGNVFWKTIAKIWNSCLAPFYDSNYIFIVLFYC